MEIICPACKKSNPETVECLRCGCDLQPLHLISLHAKTELHKGIQRLKEDRGREALEHARKSWLLKVTPGAARLGFLACLLVNRSGDETSLWYNRASNI